MIPPVTPLELLRDQLASEHPDASMKFDQPLRENGIWGLNIDQGPHRIAVEWSSERPKHFMITRVRGETLFQMGGDAVCVTMPAALAQVRGLLAEKLS
ncbi:hypothetical protein ACVIGB_000776 [Bradyrhizobium sp. USDA 4341]